MNMVDKAEVETAVVDFVTVALRQNAVYVPQSVDDSVALKADDPISESTLKLTAACAELGFGFDEKLLRAINCTSEDFKSELQKRLSIIMGMGKNWTPLVKNWKVPTGETLVEYFCTYVATILKTQGAKMPCGHIIPDGSFPLERYNGCPFCKTPFKFGEVENTGQGSQLKVLTLWTLKDLESFFHDLLLSRTPLEGTQANSLKFLAGQFELPEPLTIGMKETMVIVANGLVEKGKEDEAGRCFRSPTDVLRYLWYNNTGFVQLIEPGNILQKKIRNTRFVDDYPAEEMQKYVDEIKAEIKLKYSRPECRRVARWLSDLPMEAETMAESMHAKRGMWVRAIRALRLVEFSKRPEFSKLAELLKVFHDESYEVWLGQVSKFRLQRDAEQTLALLKTRPGAFSRTLFANMLWFGPEPVLNSFSQIANKVPARLLLTLAMYAELYFDPNAKRYVRPLGGNSKQIPANPMLGRYTADQLEAMVAQVQSLSLDEMKKRFAKIECASSTMFIDPMLYKMPLPIGDRSESIQSLPVALMGTRFPVEGDAVRLFMCWGEGLPAQHLDMDLSCKVAYDDKLDFCSYSQLTAPGCQHSGDIIHIPEKIGTAEYIELDLKKLKKLKARYVAFTSNAFSRGELNINMVVGWMSSKHPMTVSDKTGVAYDPSCVQHQVQISQTLAKGLVFGVLDVEASEIVWLEMPFGGQVVHNLDMPTVSGLLKRLDSKMTVGELLSIKAAAQNIEIVTEQNEGNPCDEVYDVQWARNSAAVTQLMID